jgi:hypothetical protein
MNENRKLNQNDKGLQKGYTNSTWRLYKGIFWTTPFMMINSIVQKRG